MCALLAEMCMRILIWCLNTRSENELPTHYVWVLNMKRITQANTFSYSHQRQRELLEEFVCGWLTIVMGCWIGYGAGTLWHDSVLWKTTTIQVTDNTAGHLMSLLNPSQKMFLLCECCCVFIPVWHPRWTVLLLFGTFRSDSECLYRAPVKMAFICFLWAASSCSQGQPAMLDPKYTQQYSCCVNTIDIQGVDLPLPWC